MRSSSPWLGYRGADEWNWILESGRFVSKAEVAVPGAHAAPIGHFPDHPERSEGGFEHAPDGGVDLGDGQGRFRRAPWSHDLAAPAVRLERPLSESLGREVPGSPRLLPVIPRKLGIPRSEPAGPEERALRDLAHRWPGRPGSTSTRRIAPQP